MSRLQWAGGVPVPVGDDIPFVYATTLLALDGDQLVDYVGEVGIDSLRGPAHDRRLGVAARPAVARRLRRGLHGRRGLGAEQLLRKGLAAGRGSGPLFLVVPPPVVAQRDASRSDAGLPDGFVFVAVARLGRWRPGDVAVANPVGTMEAFGTAFAASSGPVLCLVLQGRKTAAAAEVCRSPRPVGRDVSSSRPRTRLADAASVTADCFVSLHRASAFGPDIARALSVGCPVVATAYGGPMDFFSEQYAELVPYTLTASPQAGLPLPGGTEWAEPDIEPRHPPSAVHDDLARPGGGHGWDGWPSYVVCGPKAASRALRQASRRVAVRRLRRLRAPAGSRSLGPAGSCRVVKTLFADFSFCSLISSLRVTMLLLFARKECYKYS